MKKVLVTGATGFLGRAVCLYLKNEFEVLATGRNRSLGKSLEQEGIAFKPSDLSNPFSLERLCGEVDAVVHCAALSTAWGKREAFYRDNVLGTENLIQASLKASLERFIHISSPSIYSSYRDRVAIVESDPLPARSMNLYAWSKRLAEQHIDAAAKERQLPAITLRPQAIFGPGDTAIIPRLIEASEQGGLPVFAGRSPVLDATYVDNVAHAIALALRAPAAVHGRHYNVSNDEPIELLSFLSQLFPELGLTLRTRRLPYPLARIAASVIEGFYEVLGIDEEPKLTRYKLSVLSSHRTLDISAIKADLGYTPLVSMAEGRDRFAQWWKAKP